MIQFLTLNIVVIVMCSTLSPAYAEIVHKWVDARGITHYSDEAPASTEAPVSLIDLPAAYSVTVDVESDFYSIANQWQRLHKERIEREKLKVELAKSKAAQQPAPAQIVYVNEQQINRYAAGYPGTYYRRHGYDRYSRKIDHYHGGRVKNGLQGSRLGRTHGEPVKLMGSHEH